MTKIRLRNRINKVVSQMGYAFYKMESFKLFSKANFNIYKFLPLYLLVGASIFCNDIFSQEIKIGNPTWTIESERNKLYPNENFYVFYKEENITAKRNLDEEEKKLKDNLKTGLTSNIYESINNNSKLKTYENNATFNQSYSSEIAISSEVTLTSTETTTFYDKKNKKLYGLITVKKTVLSDFYFYRIKNKNMLIGDEINATENDYTSDALRNGIKNIESKIIEVENSINILTAIDANRDLTDHLMELGKHRNALGELRKKVNTKEIEEDIQKAERWIKDNKYSDALTIFQSVLILNPENERAIRGQKEVIEYIENNYLKKITEYQNLNQYDKAIDELYNLFKIDISLEFKYKELYDKIGSEFFKKTMVDIHAALKYNNPIQAELLYKKAAPFAANNKWEFERLGNEIYKLKLKYDIANIKLQVYNNNFNQAYSLLAIAQRDYIFCKKLQKLNNNIDGIMYKETKQNLKLEREHLYCFKIGVTAWSDFYTIENFQHGFNNLSRLTPVYSFSIYRKINIKKKISEKSKDISSSNLIGLKIGYSDLTNPYYIEKDTNYISHISKKYIYEPQLSFLIGRCLNFNIGILASPPKSIFNIKDILFCSTTLGFKIPIRRLNFDLNAKYFTDLGSKNIFLVEAGLSFNFNFKRKFNNDDKKAIKTNIKNIKLNN